MQVQRDSNGLQSKSVTLTTDSPQRPHFYLETKLDSNIKKKEYSKTYKLPRNPITPFLTHITSKNLQSTNHDNDDKEGKGKIKPPIVSFLFRPFLWRESHSLMSDSLRPHGLQPTRPLCSWDCPGKDIGMGGHSLSPEDLPDPGTEPGSPALHPDSLPS